MTELLMPSIGVPRLSIGILTHAQPLQFICQQLRARPVKLVGSHKREPDISFWIDQEGAWMGQPKRIPTQAVIHLKLLHYLPIFINQHRKWQWVFLQIGSHCRAGITKHSQNYCSLIGQLCGFRAQLRPMPAAIASDQAPEK